MAILVHHRTFDQMTPHEAAEEALIQADVWGAAEALGLEIDPDLEKSNSGMTLYISGPLNHIMDLYDQTVSIEASKQVSHIEVDSEEDERILRRYLGDAPKITNPGKVPAETPQAS